MTLSGTILLLIFILASLAIIALVVTLIVIIALSRIPGPQRRVTHKPLNRKDYP